MMHEEILQAVRAWVMLATSLPGEKVIPVDDAGTRPKVPFITVSLTTYDIEIGTDEQILGVNEEDELTVAVRGDRRDMVSLNAYGQKGADLLALCHVSLSQPVVQRFLDQKKITLTAEGATQDISELVDARREKRFVKDFRLDRAFESDPITEPHIEEVDVQAEFTPQTTTNEEE